MLVLLMLSGGSKSNDQNIIGIAVGVTVAVLVIIAIVIIVIALLLYRNRSVSLHLNYLSCPFKSKQVLHIA